ncbi:MAG TPA: hypothetical protein VGX28_01560 [Frankiaceae bacterium]|jgi:hypothetical protein|nr:hypothetical protein [Frankiaceae bacterium]
MSRDIRELLASAAATPRRPLDVHVLLGRAKVLRRRRVAFAAWALVPVTAALALFRPPASEPANVVSAPDAPGIAFELLDDGTRVYVVRHPDGTVTVLDTVSTHRPYGAAKQVGWCPGEHGFQDPQHGSRWDEYGRYSFGPAPADLAYYRVSPRGDGYVVGERVERPSRGVGHVPADAVHCEEGTEVMWDGPGGGTARTYGSVTGIRDGHAGRVAAEVYRDDAGLRVCDPGGSPCLRYEGPWSPSTTLGGATSPVASGTFVARRAGDVITELVLVRE